MLTMCVTIGITTSRVMAQHQLTTLLRSRGVMWVPGLWCSTTDDPAVIAAMLPWSAFAAHSHLRSVRWSLCAREICFKNALLRSVEIASAAIVLSLALGAGGSHGRLSAAPGGKLRRNHRFTDDTAGSSS